MSAHSSGMSEAPAAHTRGMKPDDRVPGKHHLASNRDAAPVIVEGGFRMRARP